MRENFVPCQHLNRKIFQSWVRSWRKEIKSLKIKELASTAILKIQILKSIPKIWLTKQEKAGINLQLHNNRLIFLILELIRCKSNAWEKKFNKKNKRHYCTVWRKINLEFKSKLQITFTNLFSIAMIYTTKQWLMVGPIENKMIIKRIA